MKQKRWIAGLLSLSVAVSLLLSGCGGTGGETSSPDTSEPQLLSIPEDEQPKVSDHLSAEEIAGALNCSLSLDHEEDGFVQLYNEDMTVQVSLSLKRWEREFFDATVESYRNMYGNETALYNLTDTAWWASDGTLYELMAYNGAYALDIILIWPEAGSEIPLLGCRQIAALLYDRL